MGARMKWVCKRISIQLPEAPDIIDEIINEHKIENPRLIGGDTVINYIKVRTDKFRKNWAGYWIPVVMRIATSMERTDKICLNFDDDKKEGKMIYKSSDARIIKSMEELKSIGMLSNNMMPYLKANNNIKDDIVSELNTMSNGNIFVKPMKVRTYNLKP